MVIVVNLLQGVIMTQQKNTPDVYEIVTNKMIESLESGLVPWHKPWTEGRPVNWKTQKPYQGINPFLLPGGGEYLTYKQVQEAGGQVKKGEHGHLITFWKMFEKKTGRKNGDGTDEIKRIPMLRYYYVFHISQCDGIKSKRVKQEHNTIKECEELVYGYYSRPDAPKFTHFDNGAYYSSLSDVVNVPEMCMFETPEHYYSAVFHESAHSTGHEKRLNRFVEDGDDHKFSSESYSFEELVAEMTAAMLMGRVGSTIASRTFENSAAYIKGWLKRLENDKRLVVKAAARAEKAAEYITGGGITNS